MKESKFKGLQRQLRDNENNRVFRANVEVNVLNHGFKY